MTALAARIDRLNAAAGRFAAWLLFAVLALQLAVVLLRYVFGIGSVALQEAVTYAHASAFLLAAGWVLLVEGHVRVDVLYGHLSPRGRAWIDVCGALGLLIPFALTVAWLAIPYVARSAAVLERSRDPGGLPAVYALKAMIVVFALLFALQGLALALRAAATLAAPRERP